MDKNKTARTKELKIYCLYRHIRNDTGEVFYVGIGKENRPRRTNGRSAFWKSIVNKCGGYRVEIMESNLNWHEACKKEKYFIKLYGRRDKGVGTLCNMTDGGDGTTGSIISKETIEKIRKGNLGKSVPEESYKNRLKPVVQLDFYGNVLENFKSARDAERRTGVRNGEISAVCKGKAKTTGGYCWCYKECLEEYVKKLKKSKIRHIGNQRSVFQLTMDGEFLNFWESISEAASNFNTHVTSITAVCKQKPNHVSAAGYKWSYVPNDLIDFYINLTSNYDEDMNQI